MLLTSGRLHHSSDKHPVIFEALEKQSFVPDIQSSSGFLFIYLPCILYWRDQPLRNYRNVLARLYAITFVVENELTELLADNSQTSLGSQNRPWHQTLSAMIVRMIRLPLASVFAPPRIQCIGGLAPNHSFGEPRRTVQVALHALA